MTVTATATGKRPAEWAIVEHEPLPPSIAALLDSAAAAHPDRSFWNTIEGDGASLSYAQLARLTRVCAQHLRAAGVRKGTHVAVMLPNAPGFLIAWIALCRLGAVAVMINTASTGGELARMLQGTDARFLLIDAAYLDTYRELPAGAQMRPGCLFVHDAPASQASLPAAIDFDTLLQSDSELSGDAATLDDIASIQFTSGSSGVPKACMLSHRFWLTLGKARSCVGPAPRRMLIDSPMFYLGPLWRVMMSMYCGTTLFVARKFSLSRLFDRIVEHGIDTCAVTYPVAKLEPDPRLLQSSLRWLTTYGLAKEVHAGMERMFGVPVREIYGMTEVGSVLAMPVSDTSMVGSGSCGLPVPFRRCRIVRAGKDVDTGEAGELWVAGPGMFSGYYGDPKASRDAFDGEWFKTGDLFKRDEDGYYYMLGRIKDVIRRSGENISAAEVELTVNAIDGVLEAAAVPVPDPLRGEEVKVVVARAPGARGAQLSVQEIVRACEAALSPFKVPRYVQFLDVLPKTPTGKIDKPGLRNMRAITADVFDARPEKQR
ncbi:class I adenylate-forming enzyme family protein [Caenimonas aquaedulcis]|uniref:AMP-binding protein n=1 Tax=Caenimonas aquaedulcis TaxID=2793270 RepID=A0A931H3P7_9BURK|nr:AMP-binding protein [Caenimonas aquaedulcis]MBG9387986.1 AMP-binding protein [Caenimonas aquaedulcis]